MTKTIRRCALASLIVGATVCQTGCTTSNGISLSSMNPFSGSKPASASTETSKIESIASGTKNALQKSRDAVTGVFTKSKKTDGSEPDPLSLDQKVEVGSDVFVANGRLWETTGNYQKAMESYTKALEAKPNDAAALASIARLHVRQGNHQKSVEFFNQAISQSPEDASLYNDLGLTFTKLGNHGAAVQMLKQALELAPGTSRYANNLASVQFESGDSETAFKVLVSNNKPAVAHFNMAFLHQKRGQLVDARKHLSEAMKYQSLAKTDSSVARAVERSREMLGQLDVGNTMVNMVAQSNPSSSGQPGNVSALTVPDPASPPRVMNPAMVRQTSQSVSANKQLIVKPAVARTAVTPPANSASSTQSTMVQPPTTLALAKLGSKGVPPTPTVISPTPATPSSKSGPVHSPFVMPPGF